MSSFNQNVIRHKIGLLNLAAELGYVAKACRPMPKRLPAWRTHWNNKAAIVPPR